MISALLLAATTRPVIVVGGPTISPRLSRMLPANQPVRGVVGISQIPRGGVRGTTVVLFEPAFSAENGWDRFYLDTRESLRKLEGRGARVLVVLTSLGSAPTEGQGIQSSLVRQAAKESGAEAVEGGDSDASLAVTTYLELADWKEQKKGWKVVSFDSEEAGEGPAKNAIDGDPLTFWHTAWSTGDAKLPHRLVIDLGRVQPIAGFRYVPRQDGGVNGTILEMSISVSNSPDALAEPLLKPTFGKDTRPKLVLLPAAVEGRYLTLVATKEINGGPWTTIGEWDVIPSTGDPAPRQ